MVRNRLTLGRHAPRKCQQALQQGREIKKINDVLPSKDGAVNSLVHL